MHALEPKSALPVPLFAVVTTAELDRRPCRPANFEGEAQALTALAQAFATAPRSILQKIADFALVLCDAHSAGISVLGEERGKAVFQWRAVAGRITPLKGTAIPREFSASGSAIDDNALQLLSRPARHFSYLEGLTPPIEEALVIPFHLNGEPLGTIWVVSHEQARRFDAEDARLITSLSKFAAAGCEVLAALQGLEITINDQRNAADVAAKANERKDRFIAILGHELRGHLAPTRNAAEMLKRGTASGATISWTANIIERQVGGMIRLVDDLLDVARLRVGNLQLRRTHVAMPTIVARTVETVQALLTERNQTLVVDLPPEPVLLDADVMWLSQALQNLVTNAIKYTDAGGRIAIRVERAADDVVISVSDNGIGIAPAEIEGIFELYAQAEQAGTERAAGGLGIGLYLARMLVEAHGGTLRAVSPGPGCGSEFIIRMPCKSARPPALF